MHLFRFASSHVKVTFDECKERKHTVTIHIIIITLDELTSAILFSFFLFGKCQAIMF